MASPLYELTLGWRYLHRRSRGEAPAIAALIALAGVIAGLVGLLHFNNVNFGAGLLVPCAIILVFATVMRFCSIFTTVSIVGVALGVAALVVVLSVMSGFQQAFRQKVLGVNAHIVVLKYGRDFSEYRDVLETVRKEPHVAAAAPFVFEEMMLSSGRGTSGTLVKGIDTKVAGSVIDLTDKLIQGKLTDLDELVGPDAPKPMILGKELAKKLKVKVGDRVRLVVTNDLVPSDQPSGAGQTASREFHVVGIFYAGFDEYDRHLAYVSLKDAQTVLGGNDYVTGVEMRLDDMDKAPEVAKGIVSKLGGSPFRAIDWQDLNHNLFEAVHTQKLVLSIFLTIIVIVAAFNVVAALSVLVVDKTREIAILKSMGLSPFGAARVFQVAGLSIGLIGTTLGVGLGLVLCAVVKRFSYALDPHVYLIDHLPVVVSYAEIAFTVYITLAICAVATLYPSWRAASLEPVDGLRDD